MTVMESLPRHQCLIYQGAPSRQLPALAAHTREKLQQNYRCLYLNSVPMVAGMRSYLAAAGVDVAREVEKASLVLSSDQRHLVGGQFDVERMIASLEDAIQQALDDGYAGLWATGDMTWELGSERDRWKLLEYEWRLEKLFRLHPQLSGICQYHADILPRDLLRQGLLGHPTIFISNTLSLLNPHYVHPESFTLAAAEDARLDTAMRTLCQHGKLSLAAS
jgi:MEDS: MEthanogen/methylotroph, DcmR Sensory domain